MAADDIPISVRTGETQVRVDRPSDADHQPGPDRTPEDAVFSLALRLQAYAERYEQRKDARCVFALAYSHLSLVLAEKLPTIDIADKDWIASLALKFADYYFKALDAYDLGQLEPGAWKAVLDATCRKRTSVLEELVFGMTAHIVHDLPLALCDVGLTTKAGESRVRDFHAMNDVLGGAVDPIQKAVSERYVPLLKWLDVLAEGYDEILTNYGLRISRGLAWYNAIRLLDPRSREEAKQSITRNPQLMIRHVLSPPIWSTRLAFRGMRLVSRFARRWPNSKPARFNQRTRE